MVAPNPNHAARKYKLHLRFIYGPLALAVACNHCRWNAHERKDGTGFALRSRLTKLGVAHIKTEHPEALVE